MIYKDRSKEELEAALEQHINSFSERIGHKPSLQELKQWAESKYKSKVEEAREAAFGHLSPKSLEILITLLNENDSKQKRAPIDEFLVQTKLKGKKTKQ